MPRPPNNEFPSRYVLLEDALYSRPGGELREAKRLIQRPKLYAPDTGSRKVADLILSVPHASTARTLGCFLLGIATEDEAVEAMREVRKE